MKENIEINNKSINARRANRNQKLELNYEVADYFLETVKWSKIISLICFAACILILVLGLSAFFAITYADKINTSTIIIMLLLAIIIGLYLIPTYFLFFASRNIKNGIMDGDEKSAVKGFRDFGAYFRYLTIASAISLVLYILRDLRIIL